MAQPIPIALLKQSQQKPQPYQKKFLAALQSGDRLETFSERWVRQRNESRKNFEAVKQVIDDAADALAKACVPIGQAARRAQAAMAPFARQIIEAERGSPLGRKRRRRRARGRRIQINQQGGPNA